MSIARAGAPTIKDVVITYDADPASAANPVDTLTLQNVTLAQLQTKRSHP